MEDSIFHQVPIDFGVFWIISDWLPGEKLILLYFSMSRGVAESVPFPEVQNRKGAESGLDIAHH